VLNGRIEVVLTTEILMEYEEQLGLFYSPEYAGLIVNTLVNLPNVLKVNPLHFYWLLIENDPDDNKFVDAAIAANADCIITNDRHFNILKTREFPSVLCFRLADFETVLTNF
jgi:uncharacterized protein